MIILASKQKRGCRLTSRLLTAFYVGAYDHPGITSTNPAAETGNLHLNRRRRSRKPREAELERFYGSCPKPFPSAIFTVSKAGVYLDCKWEGVKIKDIEKLVKPKAVARAVTFDCADNYRTSLFREELAGDDVLLAYKLNGELLEEGLGVPVRLIVPSKYAYKSALWVVRLGFTRGKELGFWERRGYSDSADVWKNDRFNR